MDCLLAFDFLPHNNCAFLSKWTISWVHWETARSFVVTFQYFLCATGLENWILKSLWYQLLFFNQNKKNMMNKQENSIDERMARNLTSQNNCDRPKWALVQFVWVNFCDLCEETATPNISGRIIYIAKIAFVNGEPGMMRRKMKYVWFLYHTWHN